MNETEPQINEWPDSIEEIVTSAMPKLSDEALRYFRDNKIVFLGTPEERDAGVNANGTGVFFAPHAAQMPFFMSNSSKVMVRLLAGGNGSGKSLSGEWESTIRSCCNVHPITKQLLKQPSRGRIILASGDLVDTHEIPRLKNWIPKELLAGGASVDADYEACWERSYGKEHKLLKLTNGSSFNFMNYDQVAKKFESVELDWIWADEEIPEDIYKACLTRLRKGGIMYITVTMLTGSAWMQESILDQEDSDPSIESFIMEGKDNPYVSAEQLEKILRKFPLGEREAREKGVPLYQAGRTYPIFSKEVHCIPREKVPKEGTIYMATDPHAARETYSLWVKACPNGNCYAYDLQKMQATIPRLSSMIKSVEGWGAYGKQDPVYDRRLDPVSGNVRAEVGGKTSIKQEFRTHDICYQDGTKQKNVRIFKLGELLDYDRDQPISEHNHPHLYIADDLYELITDLLRQSHHTIDDPERWHASDCLEWIACASPQYVSPVQTDDIRNVQAEEVEYI